MVPISSCVNVELENVDGYHGNSKHIQLETMDGKRQVLVVTHGNTVRKTDHCHITEILLRWR